MQKRKGISLIVLVITIIVMVILAGAIILTLNNSGIIGKASSAVEETNLATVKEVASLAWAEAYADGVRTVEDLADGTKGFETRIKETFKKNNIDVDKYKIEVTTSGVEVKLLSSMWVQEGFTVVKGNQVLGIGDIVNYDETSGGTKTGLTATEWKVLGADEEGNLLIMSDSDIDSDFWLGDWTEGDAMIGLRDCLNGAQLLDAECEPYGHGEGVVGKARSITAEDVDKVTGYDKTTFAIGKISQYGNEVTYSYNGTTKPAYTSVVASGTLSAAHNSGFYYYDGEKIEHITDLTTGETGKVFATLKNNWYYYKGEDLLTISSTENKEAFEMIFGEYGQQYIYWLATPYTYTYSAVADFGLLSIGAYEWARVDGVSLCDSSGYVNDKNSMGIRAVVTLSSDIVFTGSSEAGWSY